MTPTETDHVRLGRSRCPDSTCAFCRAAIAPQLRTGRPARYLRAAVVCLLLALGVVFALANYWSGSL